MLFDFFEKLFYRGQKKLPFSNDPTIEARRALNGRRLPEDLSDYTICLADYDSKATLDFLKPDLGWPIDFYREYIKTYAQLIRKRNGKAVVCMVVLQEYLTWLKERGLRHQPSFLDKYVEALGQKKSSD